MDEQYRLDSELREYLIGQGWMPPPEKKVLDGVLVVFRDGYTLAQLNEMDLGEYFKDFSGKRVRITIEELRS